MCGCVSVCNGFHFRSYWLDTFNTNTLPNMHISKWKRKVAETKERIHTLKTKTATKKAVAKLALGKLINWFTLIRSIVSYFLIQKYAREIRQRTRILHVPHIPQISALKQSFCHFFLCRFCCFKQHVIEHIIISDVYNCFGFSTFFFGYCFSMLLDVFCCCLLSFRLRFISSLINLFNLFWKTFENS